MIAVVKGFVSSIQVRKGRDGQLDTEWASVACGDNMLQVKVPDDVSFETMDEVLVAGELAVFERRAYIKGAVIRHASLDDLAFFSAALESSAVGAGNGGGVPAG